MTKYNLQDFKNWLENQSEAINKEVWTDFFKYAFSNGELIRKQGGNVNYWCKEMGIEGKHSKRAEVLCFELLVDWMNYEIEAERERPQVRRPLTKVDLESKKN